MRRKRPITATGFRSFSFTELNGKDQWAAYRFIKEKPLRHLDANSFPAHLAPSSTSWRPISLSTSPQYCTAVVKKLPAFRKSLAIRASQLQCWELIAINRVPSAQYHPQCLLFRIMESSWGVLKYRRGGGILLIRSSFGFGELLIHPLFFWLWGLWL